MNSSTTFPLEKKPRKLQEGSTYVPDHITGEIKVFPYQPFPPSDFINCF